MLTGSEAGAVDTVARDLSVAGHQVLNVLDSDVATSPDLAGVDAVICVRAHPLPTLTRQEAFLPTVLANGTPFVIAGAGAAHPLLDRADAQTVDLDATAVEAALARAVTRHRLTITA